MIQDQSLFGPRKLTEEETEKSNQLFVKITGQTDVDYSLVDKKDRRLAGIQGEVWFNSELRKTFKVGVGGYAGYEWIAENRIVYGNVELPGDFFIDFFGNIEVKVAENEDLCRIYLRRWNEGPTLYVAILFKEKDETFRLLGFKYGYEIYESESEGEFNQHSSFYKVTGFRPPEILIEKLEKIRALHNELNKPMDDIARDYLDSQKKQME